MLSIYEKELKGYFRTTTGAVFIAIYLFASAGMFMFLYLLNGIVAYPAYLGYSNMIFMITVPILTMRMFSEERKLKTDQLLLTSPVKVSSIVFGKYFAAITILLITLLINSINAIVISFFATGMYFMDVFAAYVGFFLVGCAFISIGMFISSLTESQVISAIITFIVLLFIYAIQWIMSSIPSSVAAGIIFCVVITLIIALFLYFTTKNIIASASVFVVLGIVIAVVAIVNVNVYAGLINSVLNWFSLLSRFSEFTTGSISISAFVYLLSFPLILTYLTIYQIEKRRWA